MKAPLRDAFAFAVFLVAAASCLFNGAALRRINADNASLARLAAGHDEKLPRDADPVLHAGRGVFLLAHDRVDDAQAELDAMQPLADPHMRAILQFGLANAHLRRALDIFSSAPMRQVAPLIGLAQSEYRQVLRADPQNWEARTNFDIASGISHDPDVAAYLKGDDMARERALVPDAPGAPNGLP
jgi:mxaK protein